MNTWLLLSLLFNVLLVIRVLKLAQRLDRATDENFELTIQSAAKDELMQDRGIDLQRIYRGGL